MKKFFKIFVCIYVCTSLIYCFTTINYTSEYQWSNIQDCLEVSNNTSPKITKNSLTLESESAILIDQKTGKILYEQNAHKQLRPASVTKIMSILLIMEAIDSNQISLDDKVSCSEKASSMGRLSNLAYNYRNSICKRYVKIYMCCICQ